MPASRPLRERFLENVKIYDYHEDDCWEWVGKFPTSPNNSRNGQYGRLHPGNPLRGKLSTMAHHSAYFLYKGEIPKGMCVLHKCDWPACVNPNHLFLGTRKDNYADMRQKGRERKAIGEASGNSKLNPDKIRAIRKLASQGIPYHKIAPQFNVHMSTVGFIMTGRTWSHVV